jgi:hypothetical protein
MAIIAFCRGCDDFPAHMQLGSEAIQRATVKLEGSMGN